MIKKLVLVGRLLLSPGIVDLLTLWNRGLRQLGWPDSAAQGVSTDRNGPLPWLTYGAIDYLDQVISSSASVLELGGGNSTRWWKARGNFVTTLESDSNWLLVIQKYADSSHLVESSTEVAAWLGGAFQEGRKFDLVMVDGVEPRSDYIKEASLLVSDEGVLVVDNADRPTYSDALDQLHGFYRLDFFGLGPSNRYAWCTSVFFRTPPAILGRSRLENYSRVDY